MENEDYKIGIDLDVTLTLKPKVSEDGIVINSSKIIEKKRLIPKRYQSYTLEQICKELELRDSPALGFTHQDIGGCIQESHITEEELLSVPGMKESQWIYIRETHEWIPCFQFNVKVNQPSIDTLVDLEIYNDIYNLEKGKWWWATPKGFPRQQHE